MKLLLALVKVDCASMYGANLSIIMIHSHQFLEVVKVNVAIVGWGIEELAQLLLLARQESHLHLLEDLKKMVPFHEHLLFVFKATAPSRSLYTCSKDVRYTLVLVTEPTSEVFENVESPVASIVKL